MTQQANAQLNNDPALMSHNISAQHKIWLAESSSDSGQKEAIQASIRKEITALLSALSNSAQSAVGVDNTNSNPVNAIGATDVVSNSNAAINPALSTSLNPQIDPNITQANSALNALAVVQASIKAGLPQTNPERFYQDLVNSLEKADTWKPATAKQFVLNRLQIELQAVTSSKDSQVNFGRAIADAYLKAHPNQDSATAQHNINLLLANLLAPNGDPSVSPEAAIQLDNAKAIIKAAVDRVTAHSLSQDPSSLPKVDYSALGKNVGAANQPDPKDMTLEQLINFLIKELQDGTFNSDPNIAQELARVLKGMGSPPSAAMTKLLNLLKPMMGPGGSLNELAQMIADELKKEGETQAQIDADLKDISNKLGGFYGKDTGDAFLAAGENELKAIANLTPDELALYLKNHTGEVVNVGLDRCYNDYLLSDPDLGIMYLIYKVIMSGTGLYGQMAYTMDRINEELNAVGEVSKVLQDLIKQLTALQNLKTPISSAEEAQVKQIVEAIQKDDQTLKNDLNGTGPDGAEILQALGGKGSDLYNVVQKAANAFDNSISSNPGGVFPKGQTPSFANFFNLTQSQQDSLINWIADQLQMTDGKSQCKEVKDLTSSLSAGPTSMQGQSSTLSIAIKQKQTSVDTLMKFNATATTMYRGFAQFMTNYSGN